ncbi:hypothetical protein HET69_21095 [Streptomyces sp. CJ_13]|uniref:hypothetical protein n=1 Tax=Streptomyces sp. CJ_13 TaxID=2724943 RepID=UPI001BDC5ED6|nr:hypothetical protein [Streptomyces sp. CJ_13]MBT1186433.1 hypothetical protein [Streptomyces sp. CJ_13]
MREQQWHLNAMKAEDIWKISTGKGVIVAVIDSGVDHIPELEGQVLPIRVPHEGGTRRRGLRRFGTRRTRMQGHQHHHGLTRRGPGSA